MSILVTGATGFLGAEIVRALLADPLHTVVVLGRDSDKADRLRAWCGGSTARLQIVAGDVLTMEDLPSGVDAIVHAAARRSVGDCYRMASAVIRTNVQGTCRLLCLAVRHDVRRFVYVSSQSVYGEQPPPWREEATPDPRGVYALSKHAAELLVQDYGAKLDWAILRLSHVYGVSLFMRWDDLVAKFTRLVYDGVPLRVHGDGRQLVDLVHVDDAARSVTRVVGLHPEGWNDTYNIGGGAAVSLNDIVDALRSVAAEMGLPDVKVKREPTTRPRGLGTWNWMSRVPARSLDGSPGGPCGMG